jgi:thiol:disulfide interchange protein DsbA
MQALSAWLRLFAAAVFVTLGLVLAGAASAQVAGKDFQQLTPPQTPETGKKIEVIEFFSYACPHCHSLEPTVRAWLKKKPADVEFRRIPVIFRDDWAPLARLYYTLETMGLVERLHADVFAAVHEQHVQLQDPKVLADWVATKGVDKQKFMDTYNSFTVQSRTQRTREVSQRYHIEFTPEFVIDGRYITAPSMVGELEPFYRVVDQLVVMARKNRGGK